MSKTFRKISNDITAAEDTGNTGELYALEDVVQANLMAGQLSITEAAELQADITIATDALQRNDYRDEGFAAIAQGL